MNYFDKSIIQEYEIIARKNHLLPVKVSDFYLSVKIQIV